MVNSTRILRDQYAGGVEREALIRRILHETHCAVRDLAVECSDGRVTVTGSCRSYYVKQLVTRAVFRLAARVTLVNDVSVHQA